MGLINETFLICILTLLRRDFDSTKEILSLQFGKELEEFDGMASSVGMGRQSSISVHRVEDNIPPLCYAKPCIL